jgi:hypothetical protein
LGGSSRALTKGEGKGRLRALWSRKESGSFGRFRGGGENGLLAGPHHAKPMIEILRMIGARLVGDAEFGAKEGCIKPISNGYMRRFKRSRSIRAFFCC